MFAKKTKTELKSFIYIYAHVHVHTPVYVETDLQEPQFSYKEILYC